MALDAFLLARYAGSVSDRTALASHVLRTGLQDHLCALAGVCVSALLASSTVPPGTTRRIAEALTSPTPGKLCQLLLWMTGEGAVAPVQMLRSGLAIEAKDAGWLGKLAQYRNRFAGHGTAGEREELLGQVAALLEEVPSSLSIPALTVDSEGRVSWKAEGDPLDVSAFFSVHEGRITFPLEIDGSGRLLMSGGAPELAGFRVAWRSLRVADAQLADPTAEELVEKALRVPALSSSVAPPWWHSEVTKAGAPLFFVSPGTVVAAASAFRANPKTSVAVSVAMREGESLSDGLARTLGLAAAPASSLLAEAGRSTPLVLCVEPGPTTSRPLLDLLYWLADLREVGAIGALRLVVGRDVAALSQDQEKLWDRLPDRLDELVRRPPRSKTPGLAGAQWGEKSPRLFGFL